MKSLLFKITTSYQQFPIKSTIGKKGFEIIFYFALFYICITFINVHRFFFYSPKSPDTKQLIHSEREKKVNIWKSKLIKFFLKN